MINFSLTSSQPSLQSHYEQLVICVAVCCWIGSTVQHTSLSSLCNYDV